MSTRLSLYAFEPGTPAVPAASGTGVFVRGLVKVLTETEALDARVRWLRHADRRGSGPLAEWRAGARWLSGQLGRLLRDPSSNLLFIYPKLPILAHVQQPAMVALARHAFQLLRWKCALTGQRIVVVVEDLPLEMAEGRATAGGPKVDLDASSIRSIERVVFQAAHRLITPPGFLPTIRDRHGVDSQRFRTFRRNIYTPAANRLEEPPLEFEGGAVDFFYSGSVDSHVAGNFREVLRSVRNAPQTRLHVCGPGRDEVEAWLGELAVPNARHYGQLGTAEHDWLAQQCDVGLILYPTDNPYNHLTPTMKYSAYLANGLAVLSTDLRAVAENLRIDDIGQALPIRELAIELMRWATRPSLWHERKRRAETQAQIVRSGREMLGWIHELAEDR